MSETHENDDLQNSKPDQREDDFPEVDQEDRNDSRNPMEIERRGSQDNGDREESKEYRQEQVGRGDRGDDEELRAKRIFVGNLSFKTSWQQLKDFMRKVGKVDRVDIFENRDGQSKGFGLVQFSTVDEAKKAVREMNQQELDGRKIFVREDDAKQTKSGPRPNRERRNERRFSPRRRSDSRSRSRSRSKSYERRKHRDSRRRSPSRSRSDSRSRSRPRHRRDREDRHDRRRDRSRSRSRSGGRRGGSRDRRDRDRDRDDRRGGGRGEGYQLVVKNMPWSVTWQQLKDAFKEYGNVLRADVPQDDKGRSKGFGYVRFEKEKDAGKAIEGMHGAAFNGRKIQVEMSHSN